MGYVVRVASAVLVVVGTFLIAAPDIVRRSGALGLQWLPGDSRVVRWVNLRFELDQTVRLGGFWLVAAGVLLDLIAQRQGTRA